MVTADADSSFVIYDSRNDIDRSTPFKSLPCCFFRRCQAVAYMVSYAAEGIPSLRKLCTAADDDGGSWI